MWKRNLLSEAAMSSYVRIVLFQHQLRDKFPYKLFLNLLDSLVFYKISCMHA